LIVKDVHWALYLLLVLGPDVGMVGYLVNPRVGATTYNLLHHKGFALVVALLGMTLGLISVHDPGSHGMDMAFYLSAIILYGHASMDRIFGYDLKFGDNFHHTHLGWIGKLKEQVP